jgi:hypothetical protein
MVRSLRRGSASISSFYSGKLLVERCIRWQYFSIGQRDAIDLGLRARGTPDESLDIPLYQAGEVVMLMVRKRGGPIVSRSGKTAVLPS